MALQARHTEEELIALLAERSERAFNELYEAYSPALYGIVVKIVHSEDIAEDLLQEAFVKIWQRADSFDRSKGSLFTWLLNVTRNHAIDYVRSKYARAQVHEAENSVSIADEQRVELPIDMIGLAEQIRTLPEDHRVLIDLLYFQGYTQKEISDEFQIPLGTIKTRVRAAFTHLRVLLKEYMYE